MFYTYLNNALVVSSLLLELALVVYLLKGRYLRYPLLLAFCVVELVTGTAEFLVESYGSHQMFIDLYYIDEVGVDLLLFLMVITFTYRAMEGNPMRVMAGRVLGVITLLVLGLPFLLFQDKIDNFPAFMNGAGEVLNFGAAIMNLVLWTALLGATRRDAQLLTVSAGLGLQVTAQALGFGIRHLLPPRLRWMPDLFMMMVHLASVYIWWRAFRPLPRPSIAPMAAAGPEIHPGEV
jgi:hypothetical protein